MNRLESVPTNLPAPPYPADTKANGWKPEFDADRIYSSDTWTLSEDDEKPWLLRTWLEAWRSVPVGSMPKDTKLFSRRIGCSQKFLEAHSETLLRGWILHSDDRLYHKYLSEGVLAMISKRRRSAERVQSWREKKNQEKQRNDTGCNTLPTRNQHVSNAQEQEQEQETTTTTGKTGNKVARCPYQKIVALYHEKLPQLRAIHELTPTRKTSIRARWQNELPDIDTWTTFFKSVSQSDFLMGQCEPTNGRRVFQADIDWLIQPANIVKIAEGKYRNG